MADLQKPTVSALSDPEIQLLEMIHGIAYGELHIIVREGRPVRVEEIIRSIILEKDKKQK